MKINLVSYSGSPKLVRLYHGSNTEFKEFNKIPVNTRHVSLGHGHYLTPNRKMAEQYGKILMVFEVDLSNLLDWDNLTRQQRKQIESELLKSVPKDRISHFGQLRYEIIQNDAKGHARFKHLVEMTKNAYNESSKAHVLSDDEIEKLDPSLLSKLKPDDDVVAWREGGDLSKANSQQLMTLMNEFKPDLAKELGYKASKFAEQVAIYDAKLAKRIN